VTSGGTTSGVTARAGGAHGATSVPGPPGLGRLQLLVGALLALVTVLQRPSAGFVYDAGVYWRGAQALVSGGDVSVQGQLELRGALTTVLYLPAAVADRVGGDAAGRVAVLVENALLIAVIGAVLVPLLVGVWRPVTARGLVVSGLLTGLLLHGLAPFPLTDLWASALVLLVVVALHRRTRSGLLVAGLAAGAAVNVRPATLVPLLAVGVAVLVARRWAAGWAVLGGALALVPQVAANLRWQGTWSPVPVRTGALTELQASYASYVVRYDTVVSDSASAPQLFWCSPGMARALDGRTPTSPGELAVTYLTHLPGSLVFALQKVGAALHWPLAAPYDDPAPGVDVLVALLVTATTVVGLAALVHRAVTAGRHLQLGQVACTLVWLGTAAGLVTSATETRFALSLVLCGVAGCALLAAGGAVVPRGRSARLWVAGAAVVLVAVYAVGVSGMQHPVVGGVTVATCADS
jgi:hypothetical protein